MRVVRVAPMTVCAQTPSLASRLDSEWSLLRTERRSIRRARSWADPSLDHPLDRLAVGVIDLADILGATHRGAAPAGHGDAILCRLIDLAADDELAGRIVLQRLLPGLITRSCGYREFQERCDLMEAVVPAAWEAIRRYDTVRRPCNVAASLQSDAVFQAFRRPLRRRSATEVVRHIRTFADTPALDDVPVALVELAAVVREARRAGVADHHLDLIRQLVSTGSPRMVAEARQVTPRTIRNHRDRAVENIRAAIGVAA